MSYKEITAKFDSECDGCGRGIDAGDSMYWAKGAPAPHATHRAPGPRPWCRPSCRR